MTKWWNENESAIRTAIDEAERSSGHQILVRVGPLGWRPERTANRIAAKYPAASLVFCVDPRRHRFEVRWSAGITLSEADVTEHAATHLRAHDLPAAIASLAALLPRREEGDEIPDVVTD